MDYRDYVRQKAIEHGIDPNIAEATMVQESGGNPNAVSPAGAIGVMQLMPGTAQQLGVNPYNPQQNIDGGVKYLADNIRKYGTAGGIAAYNAGPGRVEKVGSNFDALPDETRKYVPAVMNRAAMLAEQQNGGSQPQQPQAPDLNTLLSGYQKAKAANDADSVNEIGGMVRSKFQAAIQKAQSAGDMDSVKEITAQMNSALGLDTPAAPKPTKDDILNFATKASDAAKKGVADAAGPDTSNTPKEEPSVGGSLIRGALKTINPVLASAMSGESRNAIGKTADDFVRGVADTVTFGAAPKVAAYLDNLLGINTTGGNQKFSSYEEALKAQRQRDEEAGVGHTVGQIAGALVPTGLAVTAPANASRLARAGYGFLTGAAQGGLTGFISDDGDWSDKAKAGVIGAGIGGTLGGTVGAVLPGTRAQNINNFINKAGSDADAALNAEIAQRLKSFYSNPARTVDGKLPDLTPKEMNAVVQSFLNEGKNVITQLPKDSEARKPLMDALTRGIKNTPEELAALESIPGGKDVAEIINKATRADKMTSQVLQNPSILGHLTRIGIDAIPSMVGGAIGGPVGFAAGATAGALMDPLAKKLTGKMTRTAVGENIVNKLAGLSDDVLERTGPSTATTALDSLKQLAGNAVVSNTAKAEAMKAVKTAAADAAEQLRIRNLQLGVRSNPGFVPDNLQITGGTRGTLQYYGRLADSTELAKGLKIIEKTDPYMAPYVAAIKQNKPVPNKDILLGLTDRLSLLREQGVLKPYMKSK